MKDLSGYETAQLMIFLNDGLPALYGDPNLEKNRQPYSEFAVEMISDQIWTTTQLAELMDISCGEVLTILQNCPSRVMLEKGGLVSRQKTTPAGIDFEVTVRSVLGENWQKGQDGWQLGLC